MKNLIGQLISASGNRETTPPAPEDPYFESVALLVHFDDAHGSARPIDSSNHKHSLICDAGAIVSTTEKKFGTGSYFAPSGGTSECRLPINNVLKLDGQFTLEAWLYRTTNANMVVFGSGYSRSAGVNQQIQIGDTFCQFFSDGSTTTWTTGGGTWSTPPVGEWFHFAMTRDENNYLRIFVDGVVNPNIYTQSANLNLSDGAIGALGGYLISTWQGYIDEVRITKGICRYKNTFTLPTEQHPSPTPGVDFDPYIDNVTFLTKFDGDDGSTTFSELRGHSLVANGVSLSTEEKKFGNSSLKFTGVNGQNVITSAATDALNFPAGTDYTVEMWAYMNVTVGADSLLALSPAGGYSIGIRNYGHYYVDYIYIGAFPSTGSWHHIAQDRVGTTNRFYIDGVVQSTVTENSSWPSGTINLGYINGSSAWNGYIDSIRVTKGVARYKGAFTPPTAEFPSIGPSPKPTTLDASVRARYDLTVSNDKLTVTKSGSSANAAIRGIHGKISGKYYFEVTRTVSTSQPNAIVGICANNWIPENGQAPSQGTGYSMGGHTPSGQIYVDGTGFTKVGNPLIDYYNNVDNITTCVAVDIDNKKVWISAQENVDVNSLDYVTWSFSQYIYPAMSVWNISGESLTANFGQKPFLYAVPPGFTAGWPSNPIVGPFRYIRMFTSEGNLGVRYGGLANLRYKVSNQSYPSVDMTSDNAPSPLVSSQSSLYGAGYEAFKAFDNDYAGTYANPLNDGSVSWIKLDLGAGNEIDPTSVNIGAVFTSYGPRRFNVEGSNTGDFTGEQSRLYTHDEAAGLWTVSPRFFYFTR